MYAFRPGYIHPTKGLKRTNPLIKWVSWLYPILRILFPNSACTLKELGLSMIHCASRGYDKKIVEVKDILVLSLPKNGSGS